MPEIQIPTIIQAAVVGSAGVALPNTTIPLTQIVGLIPFTNCDEVDCRTQEQPCEYVNPVFGDINTDSSGYTNDVTPFLFEDKRHSDFPASTLVFTLQKLNKKVWDDVTVLNLTHGFDIPFGFYPGHPNYKGFSIFWDRILAQYGVGCYRVKAVSSVTVTPVLNATLVFRLGAQPLAPFTVPDLSGVHANTNITILFSDFSTVNILIPLFRSWNQVIQIVNANASMIAKGASITSITTAGTVDITIKSRYSIYARTILVTPPEQVGASFVSFDTQTLSTDITLGSNIEDIICMTSEPFKLMAWDCNRANGTIKFEIQQTGTKGDKRIPYLLYQLDGFTWHDSIRVPGYFGQQKPTYKEVVVEHGKPNLGWIEPIRNEMTANFIGQITMAPFWLHQRFMTYAAMANVLSVSDYNFNNSDWEIKSLVVRIESYEPDYHELLSNDIRARVSANMKLTKGIAGIISSLC